MTPTEALIACCRAKIKQQAADARAVLNARLAMRLAETLVALAAHGAGSPEHIAATVDLSTAMGKAVAIGREIDRIEEEAGL